MFKVAKAIVLVVSGWVAGMTLVGVFLGETVGHGDHGSILYVILAWYAAGVGVFTHLLILLLRNIQGRYRGDRIAELDDSQARLIH
jgi:hypothetical protein